MIKVYVSKEQLKKFKISQENCDDFKYLVESGHCSFDSDFWAIQFMCDLDAMDIFYKVKRTNEHRLFWEK